VFRNRDLRRSGTEILLYLLVSGGASGIIAASVAFNEYVLGFKSLIAANVAQFIFGQGIGSIFRFWAMHQWVFPESHETKEVAVDSEQEPQASVALADEGAAEKAPIS
jgi:hypothetical protein